MKKVLVVNVLILCVSLFFYTSCGGGGGGGGGASGASLADEEFTTHNPGGWGGEGSVPGSSRGADSSGLYVESRGGTPLVINSYRYGNVTYTNHEDIAKLLRKDHVTGQVNAEFYCNGESTPRALKIIGQETRNSKGEMVYEYSFNLQYKATCHVPSGTQDIFYFQNDGINLDAYHDGGDFDTNHAGTTVWGWYENNSTGGTNRYPLSANGHVMIPESDKGDHELYPVFQFSSAPTVEWITETGVQEYGGADTYMYDYAQNTNGVKIRISQVDFPGCTVTGNIDGGNAFTLRPVSATVPYEIYLTSGHHVITMNSSGSNDCAPQTFIKEIDVYVKPVLRIADVGSSSSSLRFRDTGESSTTTDIYKSSYMTYGSNMPVTGLTALPECATVDNSSACLDGSAITPSSTAALGNHTLSAEITGNYCVQPDTRNITIKIKPITAQISNVVFKMNVSVDGDFRLKGYLHLGVNGGNWQIIGNFEGNGIGMSGGDNNITGSCNAASVTLNALTDSISYEADTSDWDEYSGNDQLGYGSTGVALQTACDNRSDSNKYSIYLHTSHSDGSSDSTITVQLSD